MQRDDQRPARTPLISPFGGGQLTISGVDICRGHNEKITDFGLTRTAMHDEPSPPVEQSPANAAERGIYDVGSKFKFLRLVGRTATLDSAGNATVTW